MAELLRRRTVVVPAVLALVAGGGAVAWASNNGGGARYRTAAVTRGDVQQLLDLTGTVGAAEQAKVRFRTSGTVSAVKVTVGETVKRGQALATMDTGALQDAVTRAKATLAQAKATLESDSAGPTTPTTPTASPTASASSAAPKRGGGDLSAVQAAEEQALQQAQRALATATAACASSAAPTAAPSATGAPSATLTPSPTGAAVRSGPSAVPSPLSCVDALQASLHAQQVAADAQRQLARVLSSSSASSSSASRPSASPSATSSSSSSSPQGSRDQASSGATSSAARITLDTAAVSAAQVALAQAEQNLASVTLTAPIAGTVATIPWITGGSASASDALVILGTGPVDVTVDVPSSSIRSIVVGLPATVRVDGGTTTAEGAVTSIGLLPASSSSSTTSYPVVVRVPAEAGLVDGSAAAVSIVVKTVKGVLTIPNSALHGSTVDVLAKGAVSSVRVQAGAVGALVTEVTSGLKEGQTVVLADLTAALPTSSTTSNRFGGGLGGGGLGGADFGGPDGKVVVRRGG